MGFEQLGYLSEVDGSVPRPPFTLFANEIERCGFDKDFSFIDVEYFDRNDFCINSGQASKLRVGEWNSKRVYVKYRGTRTRVMEVMYYLLRAVDIPLAQNAFSDGFVSSLHVDGVNWGPQDFASSYEELFQEYSVDSFLTHHAFFLLFGHYDVGVRNTSYISDREPEWIYYDIEPFKYPSHKYIFASNFLYYMCSLCFDGGFFYELVQNRAVSLGFEVLHQLSMREYSWESSSLEDRVYLFAERMAELFFEMPQLHSQYKIPYEYTWSDPAVVFDEILSSVENDSVRGDVPFYESSFDELCFSDVNDQYQQPLLYDFWP